MGAALRNNVCDELQEILNHFIPQTKLRLWTLAYIELLLGIEIARISTEAKIPEVCTTPEAQDCSFPPQPRYQKKKPKPYE